MSSSKTTTSQTQTTLPDHDMIAAAAAAAEEEERLYMPSLGQFKLCGLALGFLVGLFIYLSTLGAEFIAVMLWGKDILAKTNSELVVFSLSWNMATTVLALVILTALRRLVTSVFLAAVGNSRSQDNAEDILAELLSYMEGRFAVGALVGICMAWNITNLVLGMRPQIIQSCVILAVAFLWCRMTLLFLGQPNETLIYDDDSRDEYQTNGEQSTKQIDDHDDKAEPLLVQTV